uniref:Uncharacterized protein n=1 Tax=Chromera velia CCMP2878 TaxID=1169474 RepID=A0A0G4FL51_9ALVE|eukprot:Cvel_17572.t1-p1 / transcript=Cvel_17572.t1 / gene=Cvel_17572 / organism=Chromera_velia_CCMP2878 / gene_product=hypothetical protein / transcript_product=hypothetical protein / location=Cvel_scaffold1411:46955-47338(-) / protein_length=128 / sequence_SO=supercontig / SO=protein_coding / is_pseudo=false
MLANALQHSRRSVQGGKFGAGVIGMMIQNRRANGKGRRLGRGTTGGLKKVTQGVDGRTGWLGTPASLKGALVRGPSRLTIVFGCRKRSKLLPMRIVKTTISQNAPQDREPLTMGTLCFSERMVAAHRG